MITLIIDQDCLTQHGLQRPTTVKCDEGSVIKRLCINPYIYCSWTIEGTITGTKPMFHDDEAFDDNGLQPNDNTWRIDDHEYQDYDDVGFMTQGISNTY